MPTSQKSGMGILKMAKKVRLAHEDGTDDFNGISKVPPTRVRDFAGNNRGKSRKCQASDY
jgi:hypothetical protein